MRKVVLTLLILGVGAPCFAKYSGGTGDANTPYQIANAADLMTLANDANDYNKCFIMTTDLDLDPNLPGGRIFRTAVISPDVNHKNGIYDGNSFNGVFDGAGHKITNLTIDANSVRNDYIGLFGDVNRGEIKNLSLENVKISIKTYSYYLGGLVGENWANISNCYSTGSVTMQGSSSYSSYVGGLVGGNHSNISNCYSTVFVSNGKNSYYLGGLVGWNDGTINNCHTTGVVTGGDYTSENGGLVGCNMLNGTISNCYSTGNVSGGNYACCLGGLVGWNNGTINNCHTTGNITGGSWGYGGLVGRCEEGSIIDCYSTGTVTGENQLGGLVGDNRGNVSYCHSTGNVTGGSNIGGLMGVNYSSINSCYSTGDVNGDAESGGNGGLVGVTFGNVSNCFSTGDVNGRIIIAGLVGENDESEIINCYSTGIVTGIAKSGLVYSNNGTIINCYFLTTSGPNNGYGTPLTDVQMKQQASFVGWDFVWETANGPNDIWAICEGVSYPKLAWQFIAGDSDNDKNVDFTDFALLANKWMQADSNLYCGGADLTGDGKVDIADLAAFSSNWLAGL